MCVDDSSSECLSDDDPGLALMFEHAFGVETEDELDVELESLCESSENEVGMVELERTPTEQSREDPVVLENPAELESVTSRSMELEGTPSNQSGEDPVVLENPVELASLGKILHVDKGEAEFCHVFHECEESSDFESCLSELEVGEGLVELAVDMGMCAAVTRSKHGKLDTACAASDAMWWLVDSGASTHLTNEETLQGVRVVSQSEHAGVDCVTATGASVGVRKSAVVQHEFRLGDPEGQTVLVELEVLVAPVRFNLLSLGRLLERRWDVQFVPAKASSSLFSPSSEEEIERENLTVTNTVQVLDFEDERYAASTTVTHPLEKVPLPPRPAQKARPKARPSVPKASSSSPKVKAMPKKVVLKPRKSAQMPWLTKYCREARNLNVKKAVLKKAKAKNRAKHYSKPDEEVTFAQLEKAMDKNYTRFDPPKRSVWDHLELRRQAVMAGVEAPRLISFNPAEAWVEELNQGSSTIIIHGEKMMVTTVSKTAEFGTSAAALAGSSKAFHYTLPEPPRVPPRQRLPTPPRHPHGEAPRTPPRTPSTPATPKTPGTSSKAPSAAVEIESHASWQYTD